MRAWLKKSLSMAFGSYKGMGWVGRFKGRPSRVESLTFLRTCLLQRGQAVFTFHKKWLNIHGGQVALLDCIGDQTLHG